MSEKNPLEIDEDFYIPTRELTVVEVPTEPEIDEGLVYFRSKLMESLKTPTVHIGPDKKERPN